MCIFTGGSTAHLLHWPVFKAGIFYKNVPGFPLKERILIWIIALNLCSSCLYFLGYYDPHKYEQKLKVWIFSFEKKAKIEESLS
jgi:hypothetical protein